MGYETLQPLFAAALLLAGTALAQDKDFELPTSIFLPRREGAPSVANVQKPPTLDESLQRLNDSAYSLGLELGHAISERIMREVEQATGKKSSSEPQLPLNRLARALPPPPAIVQPVPDDLKATPEEIQRNIAKEKAEEEKRKQALQKAEREAQGDSSPTPRKDIPKVIIGATPAPW
jgi:hypothetical protein